MVVAAFLAGFVAFGVMYSFGAFFEPIAVEFRTSRATTSAFFAVTGLAFYMFGSLTGYFSDRFGPRVMVGTGAIVMGTGLGLTAFVDRVWFGYLTYGLGVGFGAACAYVPTLAVVGGWFDRKRNVAFGLAASGTGCGMLLVPPLSAALIEGYGWRAADLILGASCAVLLIFCAVIVAPPPLAQPSATRALGRVLVSFEFLMLYISWVFATTALFIPLAFLPSFALEHGAGHVAASVLLSVLGGMSVLGRVAVGFLDDRISTLLLFKAAVFVMAASHGLWLVAPTYEWLVIFAAILGVGYGIRISLMPSVLIEFFGLQNLGGILGIFFTAGGISAVAGPLLAGLIVDHTSDYRWSIAFALAVGTVGFIAAMPLRPAGARQHSLDR